MGGGHCFFWFLFFWEGEGLCGVLIELNWEVRLAGLASDGMDEWVGCVIGKEIYDEIDSFRGLFFLFWFGFFWRRMVIENGRDAFISLMD